MFTIKGDEADALAKTVYGAQGCMRFCIPVLENTMLIPNGEALIRYGEAPPQRAAKVARPISTSQLAKMMKVASAK